MTLDKEGLNAAKQRYRHIDPVDGEPAETLRSVVEASENADEDDLGWIAILLIEPLLDIHWRVIGDEFEAAMRQSRKLRMAYSSAWTDIEFPEELESRLDALVQEDEHIGRRTTE